MVLIDGGLFFGGGLFIQIGQDSGERCGGGRVA
jgi:hypothetical protein